MVPYTRGFLFRAMSALVAPPGLSNSEPETVVESSTHSRERRRVALACRELSTEIKASMKDGIDQVGSNVNHMRCELDMVNQKLDTILSFLKTEAVAVAMNLDSEDITKVQRALGSTSSSALRSSLATPEPEVERSPVKCDLFNLFDDEEVTEAAPQDVTVKRDAGVQACVLARKVRKSRCHGRAVQTETCEDPIFTADPWRKSLEAGMAPLPVKVASPPVKAADLGPIENMGRVAASIVEAPPSASKDTSTENSIEFASIEKKPAVESDSTADDVLLKISARAFAKVLAQKVREGIEGTS